MWRCEVWRGFAGLGGAVGAWLVEVWLVKVGHELVRQLWHVRARRVMECSGVVGHGSLGMLWSVGIRKGKARIGVAVKVRRRWERRGAFWYGAAVLARRVSVRQVRARSGEVWQSRSGSFWSGAVWFVTSRQSCLGSFSCGVSSSVTAWKTINHQERRQYAGIYKQILISQGIQF